MSLTSNSANMTAEMILDLDGNVFGGTDPDAMVLPGTYTATEFTVSAQTDLFGLFTLTVDDQGDITGTGVNVPSEGIDNFEFTGTSSPTEMNMNYTINFSQAWGGGQAFGVLNLIKSTVGVDDSDGNVSDNFKLEQNSPNPFNPSTSISFSLAEDAFVSLTIYDLLGNNVRQLASGSMIEGSHSIRWDGKDAAGNFLSGGTYLYVLNAGDMRLVKKMVLIK